MTNLQIGRID